MQKNVKVDKDDLKDLIKTIIVASCAMLGLFAFCVICGMIFMDYDPMTMVNGIKQDLAMLFG